MDKFYPDEVAEFFDVDPLSEYDEYHLSKLLKTKLQCSGDDLYQFVSIVLICINYNTIT